LHRAVNSSAWKMNIEQIRAMVRAALLLSIVLLFSVVQRPACAQPASQEYKIKAAFIFHFAQLVDWPAGALNTGDQSINLCVFDDEPSLHELEGTLEGKLVGTRTLHVHLLNQSRGAQGCNIYFLSSGEGRHQAATLGSLRGLPVLTVGETDSFLSNGGMIRLRLESNRVRFDINRGAADSSQLKISSRLLLLAASVTLGDTTVRGGQTYAR
jgi:YfiR/HmsC-like